MQWVFIGVILLGAAVGTLTELGSLAKTIYLKIKNWKTNNTVDAKKANIKFGQHNNENADILNTPAGPKFMHLRNIEFSSMLRKTSDLRLDNPKAENSSGISNSPLSPYL